MNQWYSITYVGWAVTFVHLTLSVLVIRGFLVLEPGSPEVELFYAAYQIQFILIAFLLYARYKGKKLFAKDK